MERTAVLERVTPLESTDQSIWDEALKLKKKGASATTAMQTMWPLPPPGDLTGMATAIGSLWGDHYWAGIQMDAGKLAEELNATTGVNPADCRRAAAAAFSRWYGLFVRANFNNHGEIPKRGSVTASPDVLVNGLVELAPATIIRMWNQMVWGPQPGLVNNTYGRAQSFGIQVPIEKALVRMFVTPAGFNPPPSTWTQLFTAQGKEDSATLVDSNLNRELGPGARSASSKAFAWTPPGSGHFCLITAAGSEFFDNNPVDRPPGNWNSATWLVRNGAAGWRNFNVASEEAVGVRFYNEDETPERLVFTARCRNLHEGSHLALSSGEVSLETAERITSPYQEIVAVAEVPPRYEGELVVDLPEIPADGVVDLQLDWLVKPDHPYFRDSVGHPAAATVRDDGTLLMRLGSVTFVGPQD